MRTPYSHLPSSNYHRRFLYAIELSSGVIKVGQTYEPRIRMATHAIQAAKRGARICRYEIVGTCLDSYSTERELVRRMGRLGRVLRGHREYFVDVRYGTALTLMRQIAGRQMKRLSPEQQPN